MATTGQSLLAVTVILQRACSFMVRFRSGARIDARGAPAAANPALGALRRPRNRSRSDAVVNVRSRSGGTETRPAPDRLFPRLIGTLPCRIPAIASMNTPSTPNAPPLHRREPSGVHGHGFVAT